MQLLKGNRSAKVEIKWNMGSIKIKIRDYFF